MQEASAQETTQETNGCNVRDPKLCVKKRAHIWAAAFPLTLLMLSHHDVRDSGVNVREQTSELQEIKFVLLCVSVFSSAFDEKLSVCPFPDHFDT